MEQNASAPKLARDPEHFPSSEGPEAYRCICPFCKADLTGFVLVFKDPGGRVFFVGEPAKCRRCGKVLLYGQKSSPVQKPGA